MARRENDFYETPIGLTAALFHHLKLQSGQVIYEPCVGDGAILKTLHGCAERGMTIYSNDINPHKEASFHVDASKVWPLLPEIKIDWTITNPPFSLAYEILTTSLSNCPRVAMLLRLSFLEPAKKRADFLSELPPNHLLVMPRVSFTEDGKTDTMTCAWMVWDLETNDHSINVYTREDINNYAAETLFRLGEKK